MTNEEYIRKAVELADGWDVTSWTDKEVGPMIRSPLMRGWQYTNDLVQGHYDALAAQLVRQVDAKIGPDRTMNTIKCVVDSGVLE